jgi:integrase
MCSPGDGESGARARLTFRILRRGAVESVATSLQQIQPPPSFRRTLALGLKIGAHALRATAATNALDHEADIAKVQEWLGHANIATTRIYDRRKMKPEDSPTFKVSY